MFPFPLVAFNIPSLFCSLSCDYYNSSVSLFCFTLQTVLYIFYTLIGTSFIVLEKFSSMILAKINSVCLACVSSPSFITILHKTTLFTVSQVSWTFCAEISFKIYVLFFILFKIACFSYIIYTSYHFSAL